MDRSKNTSSNRSQKKIQSHLGGELFALGSKNTRDDAKTKIIVKNVPTSSDRKREATTNITSTNKRPRICTKDTADTTTCNSGQYEMWEQYAKECDPINFIDNTYAAIELNDGETVVRLICGMIKHITTPNSRAKIDHIVITSITYLAKMHPSFFCNDIIIGALLSILRRDVNVKSRFCSTLHTVATNLLTKAFGDRFPWPDIFLRTYIDDAINERFWSDNDSCTPFINNIITVFKTRTPPTSLLRWDVGSSTSQTTGLTHHVEDDSGDNSTQGIDSTLSLLTDFESVNDICITQERFSESIVDKYVIDAIKDQLNKRQQQDNYTRNFLKFLCTTSGISEVRSLCINRLELWIHNGKLIKFAQQLLAYVSLNINAKCYRDHEVLTVLVKMRLKTKPLINHYMSCLRELINSQPDILGIILKLVVQNELSNSRNPNNMGMLATMFQTSPDQSATNLAEIYQEFLHQRDDCLRTLRVFLRELVRMLRFDVNLIQFCKVFLSQRAELVLQIEQSEFRERIFHSMVDIVCLCMMLSVTPQAREACMALRTNREFKNNQVLTKFYNQMSQLQLNAISWMYQIVPGLFKLQNAEYKQALNKLLLLDNPEQYSRSDQWPSEPERGTIIRIISETPVLEETLLSIILIGLTKDIPFTIQETFDIILLVIKRVSAMKTTFIPAVQANKFDIIDFLFSMSEYHHPENIKLPPDYVPPKLAIIVLYWKAWLILLIISAHNPSTFGAFCWDHYPTMKMLMEMCITNQFVGNLCSKDELQVISVERDHILQFETYLAAQTSPQSIITEESAILISQLMLMDPMGPARKIPSGVLEQLKFLNQNFKLGHMFCRSRKPDFLLDIIQRQGTTQSMPWLSDLVQNSEGDLNHLPVQCLCEFLIFNAYTINEENSRDAELVNFLRSLIIEPSYSKQIVCEVLEYIFRRLSSTVKQSRDAALSGIKIIFKNSGDIQNEWLLKTIPQIPHFMDVKVYIIPQLRAACQVENNPDLIMTYIQFIAAHTLDDPVNEMLDHVIDMAQLIVERSTMFQHIVIAPENATTAADVNRMQTLKCLFVMFNNYIIKLREFHEPYEWTEYPDLLMVQFDDGLQLPLHINIIHAFIILLTYSSKKMPESMPILDYWFPPGRPPPVAFLPNMPQESMQLLPDWLKLKMIRSPVDRLIEAALNELTPDQIVLFVQNFGTPVNSMSKLLALLDTAVLEQCEAVKNAILNKAYLAQLIEIQQARGAKNGHYTVQALELHSQGHTVSDLPKPMIQILKKIKANDYKPDPSATQITNNKGTKEIDEVVQDIFKNPLQSNLNDCKYRYLIHIVLENRFCKTKIHNVPFNKLLQTLLRTLDRVNQLIIHDDVASYRRINSFFRSICCSKLPIETYEYLNRFIYENFKKSEGQIGICKLSLESIVLMLQNSKQLHETKISKQRIEALQRREVIQSMLSVCEDALVFKRKSVVNAKDTNILSCNGLLVDWIAEGDPEIITTRTLNIRYLFSRECSEFRFYLLSLISHQTNWDTIIHISDYLFNEHSADIDYSTALNYFEALTNNPKLWKGRDKGISKNNQHNNVFLLNANELKPFTQFILKECYLEKDNKITNYDYKLCSRLNLLFKITEKDKSLLVKFVEYVTDDGCSDTLKLQVLQQLYIMYPSIKFLKLNKSEEHIYKLQSLKGCQADKVSNYLITCLGSLVNKKDFEMLSSDTELLIRKLAASHPTLFLRQLSVLSSLIEGRAQNSIQSLREEYHFHRFLQILRTLELLQPMIFEDTYKNELQTTLVSYFKFFKYHSSVKETHQVLIKFVQILQSYINNNPSSSLLFVEQYVGILTVLAAKYSSIITLQQLVQVIALLQHKSSVSTELDDEEIKQDFDLDETNDTKSQTKSQLAVPDIDSIDFTNSSQMSDGNRGSVSFVISGYSNKGHSNISQHFLNLIKIIRQSNVEDIILGPLQEIEGLTSKRFSFLNELFDRLLALIFSPSAQIRSIAFIILIRHLKHNPGNSDINKSTLIAYIQCLRDENSSVAATAIDNLSEMTLLLQEYASEILSAAFSLGIRSRLNTCTQIKRVLQTLMLQHGY